MQSGLGLRGFSWRLKQGVLIVEVYVSGVGPTGAHQALPTRASATTMLKIPYERRPARLGDLAIHDPRNPSQSVMWVYRNVCVVLDNDGTTLDVGPAAQAIQRFMEAHQVSRLADHLPVVDRVDVSAKQVHVGDELKLSIVFGKTTPLESVRTDFNEVGEHRLEVLSIQPLTATYKAKEPGQARIDIPVVDRKTLLSPPLSVTINILPAR